MTHGMCHLIRSVTYMCDWVDSKTRHQASGMHNLFFTCACSGGTEFNTYDIHLLCWDLINHLTMPFTCCPTHIWGKPTSRCRSELKSSSKDPHCQHVTCESFELPPEVDRHREVCLPQMFVVLFLCISRGLRNVV